MNKTISTILTGLLLFAVSTGSSYAFFRFLQRPASSPVSPETVSPTPSSRKSKINPSLPKTEICPLNGQQFTKPEKDVWITRRPLGIMVENSIDSRPQSGLGSADIVYEAVAEGGVTRFMGMYYCDAAMTDSLMVAPVRSARIYFVNLVSEYDALYNHVGGAGNCDDVNVDPRAKALCLINTAKIKNMDQMGYAGDFKICHRLTNRLDRDVAYEHTMACFVDEIYNKAAKLNWTNVDGKGVSWDKNFVSWKFKSADEKAAGSDAKTISYIFWSGDREFNQNFDVKWEYDPGTNSYKRYNNNQLSVDLNTNSPLKFNTVIVQFAKETLLGDLEKHLLYDVVGKGKAIVFMDGVAVDATWTKTTRTSRTLFYDLKGKELKLNPGPIWISILPLGNSVEYN
jgi:hypothetical protein